MIKDFVVKEVEPRDAAIAAVTFVDHLARTLVHKGVITHQDRELAVANAIKFLEQSDSPEAQAAAKALQTFWEEGW